MIDQVVSRLRTMPLEEIGWRVQALARRQRQRVTARVQPPRWRRAAIGRVLGAAVLTPEMRQAITARDWTGVERRLETTLRARPSHFVLDPGARETIRDTVRHRWPAAASDAAARAARILAGEFDLLGYRGLSFAGADGAIDWHLDPVHGRRTPLGFWGAVPYLDPRSGDHKIIWELNRQQHWLALGRAAWLTGDRRYAAAIVREHRAWLAANPPLTGTNWASMLELGFRSLSWVWGLQIVLAMDDGAEAGAFAAESEWWLLELLVALDRQLSHVAENLSWYFSPNTHLTGEALALYVVGLALPELAGSAQWADLGRRVLLAELDRQIERDGGHAERSTHYHRYTLDFYLLALLAAERAGDHDAAARFSAAVSSLADFAHAMAGADGTLPRIGDDDGGMLWPMTGRAPADVRDSLALAAVVLDRPDLVIGEVPEEVIWLTASRPELLGRALSLIPPAPSSRPAAIETRVFPATGYVTARDERGDHLVFDVGRHGYLNGGHAHADALALTLALEGQPLLIDTGTPTYTMDLPLRDRSRASASHNTVTIDGESSGVPAGPFHWRRAANAVLHAQRSNPGFFWVEAFHDGYGAVRHRRTLVGSRGGTLVLDEVLGDGSHQAQSHWHLDPGWTVRCETNERVRFVSAHGTVAWLLHDAGTLWLAQGDETTGLGWYSPIYGLRLPTSALRITRTARAPFSMATWIGTGDPAPPPALHRLVVECEPAGHALGVRVTRGTSEWVTLVRPGDALTRDVWSHGLDDYYTNGRALQYQCRGAGGRLLSLSAADFSHVLALRDGLVSVTADHQVQDCHLVCAPGAIDVWSSAPPARLRLQGTAVLGADTIRLNGRTQAAVPGGHGDTLVLHGEDWGDPRTSAPPAALKVDA